MHAHRVARLDEDAPTFERIRRQLGNGHDYATNRGALKGRRGTSTGRRRYRPHARRVASRRVPASLARLLGL